MAIAQAVLEIFRRIEAAGGNCLIVGGYARDTLLGIHPKDVDVEVYGLNFENITQALEGLPAKLVGRNFGILKLSIDGIELDISIPRYRNVNCGAYDDGLATLAPEMTPKEAAARRDFTVNALAIDRDGKLLDYFGGQRDLNNKVLRATSELFAEDTLRPLRGMQLVSRLGMKMDQKTILLCQSMAPQFSTIAQERIWVEWQKLMSKGMDIAAGLDVLQATNWLLKFPELQAIVHVPQDAQWHPEGDVWQHTMHVCNAAREIADRENLQGEDRLTLLFSSLLHDLGKATTTERNDAGRWTAPKHAQAGVFPAELFLRQIGSPQWLIDQVLPLVKEHMAHLSVEEVNATVVRRLANRLSPASMKMWSWVVEADYSGRPPLPKRNPVTAYVELAEELAIKDSKPKPILQGRDLIALGMKPGKTFGEILDRAYEAQLDGVFTTHEQGVSWLTHEVNV